MTNGEKGPGKSVQGEADDDDDAIAGMLGLMHRYFFSLLHLLKFFLCPFQEKYRVSAARTR